MLNKSLILTLLLICSVWVSAQTQTDNVTLYQGNREYKLKNYEGAQKYYEKVIESGTADNKTHFNLGDTYYQQGKYDEAAKKFEEIAETAKTTKDKSKAYHNLGNSWLKKKEYQKSIDAYKNALKNNPSDEDTRYNLAYAQKKLNEQNKKNQQKKDQNEKNKDKNKDEKEKDKDKKKDENKEGDKEKDKKDGDKDKDKKEEEKDKDKKEGDDKKDKSDEEKKANPKPAGIDKKQAEQILNAQNNREKELHKMMQAKKMKKENPTKPEKDW